jgi:nucleolar protein 15
MAVDKKRKSVDAVATATKKAKTAPAVEKAAPLKSALKGSKAKVEKAATSTAKVEKKKDNGAKKEKTVAKAKKPINKKPVVMKEIEVVEEEPTSDADEAEAEELTADQTAELLAGFSSSEDEADEEEEQAIAISEIPNAPIVKHVQKHIRKKTGISEHNPDTQPGTVHMSRLPHGFFEPQMRAYLEQFGTITHLRLARNRKTGKSKHFAFIEFASSGVADIVAKTMDKYLLFGHIMQARRVPDEQITEDFWKGEGKKRVAPRNKLEGVRLRKGMDREAWEKRVDREEQKRVEKAEKMKELGYKFDMPSVKGVESVPEQKVLKQADEESKAIETGAAAKPAEVEVKVVTEEPVNEPVKVTVAVEEKPKKRAASKDGKAKAKKAKKN